LKLHTLVVITALS